MTSTSVHGEPLAILMEALEHVELKPTRSGLSRLTMRLEPRLAQPLFRALMRAQAELMLSDGDRLGQARYEDRTHDQRAADAFVALTRRIADAARAA